MPWRTAIENIALPLEMAGQTTDVIRQKSTEMIELVGLQEFANAYPDDLSGGMAQRVSIARALIQEPDILLLDEPFGSLDALTRDRMGGELLRIWQTTRTAVILVTHSIPEALLLADRVLVLSPRPGRIILDMPVSIPRPRNEEIRYSSEFLALERRLRAAIQ
jgi:NitT/TauT family transport system ATP-binding protein